MNIFFYTVFVYFLCIATLPLQVFIGLLIVITSGMPMLFFQKRIGKDGKTFTIFKFRTMQPDAEKKQKQLSPHNEAHGPVFKIRNDPRFTPLGKFLAHTGLDELPQIYNVCRGEMSIIGPRPLPVAEEKKLKSWQRERNRVKPGIVSPWVLEGYHHQTFDAWMKSDIAYARQKSFWYDVSLFFRACGFLATLLWREITH